LQNVRNAGCFNLLVATAFLLIPGTEGAEDLPGSHRGLAGHGSAGAPLDRREPAEPQLRSAAEIISRLRRMGRFEPIRGFYDGHMGRIYDDAMSVVSRDRHYVKLREDEKYLDPTTEAHESLHGMSASIRNLLDRSGSDGFNMIYVGRGQFAGVRLGPGIAKRGVRGWVPTSVRASQIVKTHLDSTAYSKGHVALILEELAYHVLDGRIGLENHGYLEEKLGIRNAVTAPAADWSIVALATATMLEDEPGAFPSEADRRQFNALVRRLVEEAVAVYSRGMDGGKYGMLANLAPELRTRFDGPLEEDSPQARAIVDFCERTYGKGWLRGLFSRLARARESTDPVIAAGIYNP